MLFLGLNLTAMVHALLWPCNMMHSAYETNILQQRYYILIHWACKKAVRYTWDQLTQTVRKNFRPQTSTRAKSCKTLLIFDVASQGRVFGCVVRLWQLVWWLCALGIYTVTGDMAELGLLVNLVLKWL